ncbi:hypothetical protein T484DRAFT_1789363 [Baffinella frigidus]|nr:hypothetical protein T484DRAFT_1789363 [Cryptophyta sp. CCMP2293]
MGYLSKDSPFAAENMRPPKRSALRPLIEVLRNPEKFRAVLRTIVNARLFNAFIYLCIFYNTATMGMNDYYVDRDNSSFINKITDG